MDSAAASWNTSANSSANVAATGPSAARLKSNPSKATVAVTVRTSTVTLRFLDGGDKVAEPALGFL